jgi:hypothetical protein
VGERLVRMANELEEMWQLEQLAIRQADS